VLDNRDGRFSWRKPTGLYYGVIGRNTPLRVSLLPPGATRRLVSDSVSVAATTPDGAAVSITGDIDIRYDGNAAGWSPNMRLVSKYPLDNTTAGQRSYKLTVGSTGLLYFWWSTDGTAELFAASTVPVPVQRGRLAVRCTVDVNNGAGGRTITFYTAPTMAGSWTQLGDPVVQVGTTSIFDSTSPLQVVMNPGWEVYSAEVRNGIAGTAIANPDFTTQAEGATSFADAAGRTWTIATGAAVTSWLRRFTGEVANWPTQWGVDERDIRSPITAAGVTRRLGQGAAPLQSALRRGIGNTPELVAYWPMEDTGGNSFASALSGGAPMTTIKDWGIEAAADDTIEGSEPLPVMKWSVVQGAVPAAAAGTVIVRAVMYMPAAAANGVVMAFWTSSGHRWELLYQAASNGTLGMRGYNAEGTNIAPLQTTHTNVNGARFQISMELTTSGANLVWRLDTVNIDTDSGAGTGNTVASTSVGYATAVVLEPDEMHENIVLGHVHVLTSEPAAFWLFENYVRGQVPETPGRRVERLATEEGVPFVGYGMLGWQNPQSVAQLSGYQGMGPQRIAGLLETFEEAAAVDLGMLIEPRDVLGIGYRSRESLYNQPVALAVDYSALGALEPVDDDQNVRNDITVSREGGTSVRQRLTTGPLSVQAPPNGVGIYDDQIDLNVQLDSQLTDQAGYRLRIGTIDEARYPNINLTLAHQTFRSDAALTLAALRLDQGDLLTISNPPAWVPPDTIRQIAQGFSEVITDTGVVITVNCTPAVAWDVFVLDSATLGRLDATTLVTNEALDTTETGVDYTGEAFITTAGFPTHFPVSLMIGGEQVTATAATGTTITVTRSANGAVKAHNTSTPVRLARPAVLAM
jgi:hypothetical protein